MAEWFLLALGSAILWSVSQALNKKVLLSEHSLSFSAGYAGAILIFSLPLLLFADFSSLTTSALVIIYASSVLSTLALWLIAKGIKHLELSVSSPLLITSVLFVPIIAFFLAGERLLPNQILGILLIFGGVLFIESLVVHGSFLPFAFHPNKYQLDMIIAAFLMSLSAVADKIILSTVPPFTFVVVIHFFISLNSIALLMLLDHDYKKDIGKLISKDLKTTAASAVLSVLSGLLFVFAVTQALVSLTIAVKRLQSLFSVFLGGRLFHEKNIGEKMFATLIMVAGAVLLALS